jgi:3-hydroxybutyryl-CoA dehydratase
VHIGETVTATCTVREVNQEKRRVIFDCVCKVGETTVVDGEALVMAPPRPKAA